MNVLSLPIINSNAAGIDVSATMHVVAVSPEVCAAPVRVFEAFTEDLHELANWLKQCDVKTVAMESTGVYWQQLCLVLVEQGLEVALVNARHVKNVTGRKTDMADAQWLQKLHSCGLLRSSFLPDELTGSIRSLVRHRRRLLKDSSTYVQRMQKALELMNVKLHGVITDLMGKTGRLIIEAILRGERDTEQLLQYIDPRIRADREKLRKSLVGNWRSEYLFLLEENYRLYQFMHERMSRCDQQIAVYLQQMAAQVEGAPGQLPGEKVKRGRKPGSGSKNKPLKKGKNKPAFNVSEYLLQIHGVNVLAIPGISDLTALDVLAETGRDLSKWEDEDKFVSWLNLCPNNKITGGKLISSAILKRRAGLATQAFRAAANGLQRSDHWLGNYFRRMKAKGGNKYAIIATARKIAIIYYKMVRYKQSYQPVDMDEYNEKYKAAKVARLEKQLAKLKTAV